MSDDLPAKSGTGLGGLRGIDESVGKATAPAAEEFGREIAPLGKRAGQLTNRVGTLLIRPLEAVVFGLEKAGDWVSEAVAERLSGIPEDKIVPPNPRIAVPAMQALTYSLNEEIIREMFANLLAADMNLEKRASAHPAFVEFIKEMTPIDARVMRLLIRNRAGLEIGVRIGSRSKFSTLAFHYSIEVEGVDDTMIGRALNNLERLGLVAYREEYQLSSNPEEIEKKLKVQYEPLLASYDTPEIKKRFDIPETGKPVVTFKKRGIYPTLLGSSFADICLNRQSAKPT